MVFTIFGCLFMIVLAFRKPPVTRKVVPKPLVILKIL
jgi:hypothetical protein